MLMADSDHQKTNVFNEYKAGIYPINKGNEIFFNQFS